VKIRAARSVNPPLASIAAWTVICGVQAIEPG
jgi:hypothetical protein